MSSFNFLSAYKVGGMKFVMYMAVYLIGNKILGLDIFSRLSSGETYNIFMTIFLSLVFIFLLNSLTNSVFEFFQKSKILELGKYWRNIHEVNCNDIIITHFDDAIKAMSMTSSAWNNGYIDKHVLFESYGEDFCLLYNQINKCKENLKGYNREKKAKDSITNGMKKTYEEMNKMLKKVNAK